jgi:hypothetical protein
LVELRQDGIDQTNSVQDIIEKSSDPDSDKVDYGRRSGYYRTDPDLRFRRWSDHREGHCADKGQSDYPAHAAHQEKRQEAGEEKG